MQATIITRPRARAQRGPADTPAPRAALRVNDVRRLAQVEIGFARAQVALSDLASLLHQVAGDAPACGPAALGLRLLRAELRAAWERCGEEVADALEGGCRDAD